MSVAHSATKGHREGPGLHRAGLALTGWESGPAPHELHSLYLTPGQHSRAGSGGVVRGSWQAEMGYHPGPGL